MMVQSGMLEKQGLYKCAICGLHYRDEERAEQCEAWCAQHASCSLEITRFAEERKGG